MRCYSVAKTLYINNAIDKLLKYEIVQDESGEILFATAFVEVIVNLGSSSVPVWAKIEDLTLDHLEPPKNGVFQTEVRMIPYPGKSIATVIDVCKQHRRDFRL